MSQVNVMEVNWSKRVETLQSEEFHLDLTFSKVAGYIIIFNIFKKATALTCVQRLPSKTRYCFTFIPLLVIYCTCPIPISFLRKFPEGFLFSSFIMYSVFSGLYWQKKLLQDISIPFTQSEILC